MCICVLACCIRYTKITKPELQAQISSLFDSEEKERKHAEDSGMLLRSSLGLMTRAVHKVRGCLTQIAGKGKR